MYNQSIEAAPMEQQMTDAAKFYGTAFTPERAENLTKAVKYLDMALRNENEPGNKADMAMNAALKAEAAAFA
jgi:hypothetical protein